MPISLRVFASTLLAVTLPLQAQVQEVELPAEPAAQTYGTPSNYLVLPSSGFTPLDPATGYTRAGFVNLHRTGGGSSFFVHPINLPSGAFVESITAFVADTHPTLNVTVALGMHTRQVATGHNAQWGYYAGTGTTGTPGQTIITNTVNRTPLPVATIFGEPEEVGYAVMIQLNAADNTQSFNGARVKWRLQVAPAPVTATFTDVPTDHPFFRFVEALAAAGITAGCSGAPPQFCPDAPITRGEMAVFLSAALGLHFAP